MPVLLDMLRAYSNKYTDHFYTTSEQEMNALRGTDYIPEGPRFRVQDVASPDTVPLYRLYDRNDHLYTTNLQETDALIRNGWTYEGIAGYVWTKPGDGLVPVARLYGHEDHFYVTGADERRGAEVNAGYVVEADAAFYVVPVADNWQAKYHSIEYGEATGGFEDSVSVAETIATNSLSQGGASNVNYSISGTKTNNYSWGVSESHSYGGTTTVSTTISAGAKLGLPPEVAEGSVSGSLSVTGSQSFTFDLTHGNNKQWSDSSSRSFNLSGGVPLYPGDSAKIKLMVRWKDGMTIPFNMLIDLSCTRGTQPMTGAEIAGYLKRYNDGKISVAKVGKDFLRVHYAGEFRGSFSTKSYVDISPLDPGDKMPQ